MIYTFYAEDYTTAIRLIPIYLKAKENNLLEVYFVKFTKPDSSLEYLFNKHKIDLIIIEDIIPASFFHDVSIKSKEIKEKIIDLYQQSHLKGFNYKSVPIFELNYQIILNRQTAKYRQLKMSDFLLNYFKPDVVIAGYDSGWYYRYLVQKSKEYGVPYVHIQYGCYNLFEIDDVIKKQKHALYYCIWGKAHEETYLLDRSPHTQKSNICITGNPTFDLFNQLESIKYYSKRPTTPPPVTISIILWQDLQKFHSELSEIKHRRVQVNLKLHPNLFNKIDNVSEFIHDLQHDIFIVDNKTHPIHVLQNSKYLVSLHFDTYCSEALNFGCDVIVINLRKDSEIQKRIATAVFNVNSFTEAFNISTQNQTNLFKNEVNQYLNYKNDYKASERILSFIDEHVIVDANLRKVRLLPNILTSIDTFEEFNLLRTFYRQNPGNLAAITLLYDFSKKINDLNLIHYYENILTHLRSK